MNLIIIYLQLYLIYFICQYYILNKIIYYIAYEYIKTIVYNCILLYHLQYNVYFVSFNIIKIKG